jgi:dTDP-4-amino-4,6-dideoxygalactose transaminase
MKNIPPVRPYFPEDDIQEALKEFESILQSGMMSHASLDNIQEFEKGSRELAGTKHAIAVNNGTTALQIAYEALGIRDKKILIPVNTFGATINAALMQGGKPVLVDTSPETLSPSLDQIKAAVEKYSDIEFLVLVHIGGVITPEIEEIKTFCDEKGITLIEDAAHAHGSTFNGKHAGSWGKVATLSYFGTKVISSAGEGGMILTNDDEIAEKAQIMRNHGMKGMEHVMWGINGRLPEALALAGHLQTKALPEFLKVRQRVAQMFDKGLAENDFIEPFLVPEGVISNFYKYVVSPKLEGFDRALLKKLMKENHGVSLSGEVYEVLLHQHPFLQGKFEGGHFSQAEKFAKEHFCLPVFNNMTNKEVKRVLDALKTQLPNAFPKNA